MSSVRSPGPVVSVGEDVHWTLLLDQSRGTRVARAGFDLIDEVDRTVATREVTNNCPDNAWVRIGVELPAHSRVRPWVECTAGGDAADVPRLLPRCTDLGAVIQDSRPNAWASTVDPDGVQILCAVLTGTTDGIPARLAVIDADSGLLRSVHDMPGIAGSWSAMTTPSHDVIVAGYLGARFYRYSPGSDSVREMGEAAGESFLYGVAPGPGGTVTAGTYPGARVVTADLDGGRPRVGSSAAPGEQYVRGTTYDPLRDVSWLGVGGHAALVRWDRRTDTFAEVLPEQFRDQAFVYELKHTGEYLITWIMPSHDVLILRDRGDRVELAATIPDVGSQVGRVGMFYFVSDVIAGALWYTRDDRLASFDLVTLQERVHDVQVDFTIRFITQLESTNDEDLRLVLAGWADGRPVTAVIDPHTEAVTRSRPVPAPSNPVEVRSLVENARGDICASGYLLGGLSMIDPLSERDPEIVWGTRQCEDMHTTDDGLTWMGLYPNAAVAVWDPSAAWNPPNNPREVAWLDGERQDRPFAITSDEHNVYLGTYPDYGQIGGAFTVLDRKTHEATVHRGIVPGLSIVALAVSPRYVFGSGTIWGGMGSVPEVSHASIFRYDPSTRATTILACAGLPEVAAITALCHSPYDDLVWGLAEGWLFAIDETGELVHLEHTFPQVSYVGSEVVVDGSLVAADSFLYGAIDGRLLFEVDLARRSVMILDDRGAAHLKRDRRGILWFDRARGGKHRLARYVPQR